MTSNEKQELFDAITRLKHSLPIEAAPAAERLINLVYKLLAEPQEARRDD